MLLKKSTKMYFYENKSQMNYSAMGRIFLAMGRGCHFDIPGRHNVNT